MCGIAGVYFKKKINKNERIGLEAAIRKMNSSQARRGPDDDGVNLITNNSITIAFGHRRLSILDLSKAGHQPMTFGHPVNNSITITFNGEIYNFEELRKDLGGKGHKFKTKTDTEIILALYVEYGEKSFAMLRGMFAFGLWDGKNRKLFLVKDRYGIKPLYYYGNGEKMVFASTVKAIAESGLVPVEKNPQAFIGFLLFGSVPLPLTTLKNVFAVPAGHYLEIGADGKQKLVKYYDSLDYFIKTKKHENIKVDETIGDTRNLLNDAVRSHLISDAPLGVFLSGGLDSSALAAIAASYYAEQMRNKHGTMQKNRHLITLSVIFDEEEFSEEHYSDLVAKKIGSDHRKIKITKQDFYDSFNEIFEAMDQPTVDGVNTFFIAKAAKQAGLKVVLSGLGADEIFLGYPYFKRVEILRKIQKTPGFFKMPLKFGAVFGDKYSKLSYFANNDILSFYLGFRGLFAPQEVAKNLDISTQEVNNFISELSSRCPVNWTDINPINLLSYLELKFYLQNQLLKDTDFMSMHHSVEVRVPFLDHKLVEYISSLPPKIKLNLGTSDVQKLNKPLLVAAVRDLLPSEIFSRPKMGFTFPFQKWLQDYPITKLPNCQITKSHWSRFWAQKVLEKFAL